MAHTVFPVEQGLVLTRKSVVSHAGGDLHYHLSQHGVFSEAEMRFYAAEIILGLEHMHNRFVVYRDLKVAPPPPTTEGCLPPSHTRTSR